MHIFALRIHKLLFLTHKTAVAAGHEKNSSRSYFHCMCPRTGGVLVHSFCHDVVNCSCYTTTCEKFLKEGAFSSSSAHTPASVAPNIMLFGKIGRSVFAKRWRSFGAHCEFFDCASAEEWKTAVPYDLMPGPKPWPFLGNNWRFIPYVGMYKNE